MFVTCHLLIAQTIYIKTIPPIIIDTKMSCFQEVTDTECSICGRRFPTPATLRNHIESVHMKMKTFSCELCGKSFSKKGGLKIHMEAMHGDLPSVMCNICGAELRNENTLKVHLILFLLVTIRQQQNERILITRNLDLGK